MPTHYLASFKTLALLSWQRPTHWLASFNTRDSGPANADALPGIIRGAAAAEKLVLMLAFKRILMVNSMYYLYSSMRNSRHAPQPAPVSNASTQRPARPSTIRIPNNGLPFSTISAPRKYLSDSSAECLKIHQKGPSAVMTTILPSTQRSSDVQETMPSPTWESGRLL